MFHSVYYPSPKSCKTNIGFAVTRNRHINSFRNRSVYVWAVTCFLRLKSSFM
jgi:hypothetical protein